MFDLIESIRAVIDAPPAIVLACPVGIIAALHFANAPDVNIKGARCDSVVRQAKAEALLRPRWVKRLGIGLGLSIAGLSCLYVQDPGFWPTIFARLPFSL